MIMCSMPESPGWTATGFGTGPGGGVGCTGTRVEHPTPNPSAPRPLASRSRVNVRRFIEQCSFLPRALSIHTTAQACDIVLQLDEGAFHAQFNALSAGPNTARDSRRRGYLRPHLLRSFCRY